MENNWVYDGETYCDACLPVSANHPEVADGSGEQDCPAHCCDCGRPVDYSLTEDGIRYVLQAIKRSIYKKEHLSKDVIRRSPGYDDDSPNYYAGSPTFAIVRDWAEDLSRYFLDVKQMNLVNRYLELTDVASAEES